MKRFQLELLPDEFGLLEERSIKNIPSIYSKELIVDDIDMSPIVYLFPDAIICVWFGHEDSSRFYKATQEFIEFFNSQLTLSEETGNTISNREPFYIVHQTPEEESKIYDYLLSLA